METDRRPITMLQLKTASRPALCMGILFSVFIGLLELLTRFVFTLNFNFEFNIGTYRQLHPTRRFSLVPGYTSNQLSINSLGFLGTEFHTVPHPGRVRIISIGDSVTFSPPKNNYPRMMENHLRRVFGQDLIEVIVAAVPGYNSHAALDWYDEFLHKLRADIIIIYLGWNDMGELHPFGLRYKNEGQYREQTMIGFLMKHLYFARIPYFFLGRWERSLPVDLSPLTDEQVSMLEEFYPLHYEANLSSLIRKAKSDRSLVYLLSLPGLITHPPTKEELEIMHFPRNMKKKLALYQGVYEKYLSALQKVAAQTTTAMISLDHLIRTPEQRRIFRDTMHIDEAGADIFGSYIAEQIKAAVADLIASKKRLTNELKTSPAANPAL